MSHLVTIKTEVRDAAAVRAACLRLSLPEPVQGTTKLFSGQVTGLAVQLPNWVYPVNFLLGTVAFGFQSHPGVGAIGCPATSVSKGELGQADRVEHGRLDLG